jgi:membrane protease YdiL (CAAX protease family)
MNSTRNEPHDQLDRNERYRNLRWYGVVFAIVFPTLSTWAYFVLSDQFSTSVQQAIYLLVKTIQFAFPLVWTWAVLREVPQVGRPNPRGLALGAVFSVLVVGAGWLVFDSLLRDTTAFAAAAPRIREKIAEFGIDSWGKYAVLAVFYSLIHSLLEEYYWRWFVFGQLRGLVALWPAIVASALAFLGHHVLVLSQFFAELPWLAWLFSAAVAVGGAFWAWLYERSGSLYSAWFSHLLIDAGIFWIGYELIRHAL